MTTLKALLLASPNHLDRLRAAYELVHEGPPGLASLVELAIDPSVSSDLRIVALQALPIDRIPTHDLELVARAFMQDGDPVLRNLGIDLSARADLTELANLVAVHMEDAGEFWDLDDHIRVADTARAALIRLRHYTCGPQALVIGDDTKSSERDAGLNAAKRQDQSCDPVATDASAPELPGSRERITGPVQSLTASDTNHGRSAESSDQAKHDAIISIIRASDLSEVERENLVRFAGTPATWREFRADIIHYVSILSDLPSSRLHRIAVGRLIRALESIS